MGIINDEFNNETIVFGGGCFWCTEAIFKMIKGVLSVEPGYAGGNKENPAYEEVITGETGHAEVVKIIYDPKIISFRDLLTVFFATHDPTTKDRQGNDVGNQYRSIILYTTLQQKKEAKEFIEEINSSSTKGSPVVTYVAPLGLFYEAENIHKNYYDNYPEKKYCQLAISPKLDIVKQKFAKILKHR